MKGPELLSKWLGESERALASLFKRARLASPAVIFFDEVDSIASKRGGSSSGGERLLSQLLTELDGIRSTDDASNKGRVVIVCATNRPDLLDSALMRPGRIDRMIYVGVPDERSRFSILQLSLQGKSFADDIDVSYEITVYQPRMQRSVALTSNLFKISRLAEDEISGGLSGAELVAACRDAALMALEEADDTESGLGIPRIAMHHLLQTLSSMERQISQEMIDFYDAFRGIGEGKK